jgi:hypothetical protein
MGRSTAYRLFACCALVAACGGEAGAPSQPDATAGGEVGEFECRQVTLPATRHRQQYEISDTVPTGRGGTLKDGDYELVLHVRYVTMEMDLPESSTSAALRLREGARVMDYTYDERVPGEPENPSGFTARVATAENALQLEMVCPDSGGGVMHYTASGNELSLFESNDELRFQRRNP